MADFIRFGFPAAELEAHTPLGWELFTVSEAIAQEKVGRKYDNKSVLHVGSVPVLNQQALGFHGYHNDEPGVFASQDNPVVTFANHTCAIRLVDFPFSAIQNVFVLRGRAMCSDTRFLKYWLTGRIETDSYRGHFPDLLNMRLPLPPLPEQRRIAGVLGALDDLIDTNEKLISDLDELSMSLFLDSWDRTSWCEIQDLGKLTMGQSPPGTSLSDEHDGLPFFQGVRDFGSRFPTQRIFTKDSKRQVSEGAILIAVRAPVGEANVALTEVSIGRGLAGLEATDPAIALQALRATSETWDAHQGAGTVFSSINGNELKKARVPLVRDDGLSQVLAVLDMQFKELFLENQQLRQTRDELLPLLMSGKIRVREAEELVKERVG